MRLLNFRQMLSQQLFDLFGRLIPLVGILLEEAAEASVVSVVRIDESGIREILVTTAGTPRLSRREGRGQRVFVTATVPPEFTLKNYETILFSGRGDDNMAKAFFNTMTVTIPATVIPIVIAAFAAYALAWMQFPGRALLIACVLVLIILFLFLTAREIGHGPGGHARGDLLLRR